MTRVATAVRTLTAPMFGFWGMGLTLQSSTEPSMIVESSPVFKSDYSFVQPRSIQTASSVINEDLLDFIRLGGDNYLRLQEISKFEYGWDGDKAKPIPVSVISRVKELLVSLPSGAQIFPTGRRSVQIEYHKDDDHYLELEISSRSYSIYTVNGDSEFEGTIRKNEIKRNVESFMSVIYG